MSKQTHGIPQKGSGGLILGGVLLLSAAAGIVYWKIESSKPEPITLSHLPEPKAQEPSPPRLNNAPPPPPPQEEEPAPDEGAAPAQKKRGTQLSDSCEGECNGNVTPTLRSALARRAAGARTCYNAALRRNASLQGKMTVSVRVSPSGRTCSAEVSSSTLGDPSVDACVANQFRATSFPPAVGGCIDAAVPIVFTKEP